MILCRLLVYFVIFSFMGWIYETIVCTIKWKRWENRGFLYGPICPIYGTGAICAMVITEHVISGGGSYEWWQVFLYSTLGSIVLEYTTHWTLEKLFHARWWDYSYMPLNIKGRVCLPFSLGFGLAGLLIVYVINPFVHDITSWISPLGYEFMGLVFMGLIGMDIALTASALAHFDTYVKDTQNALNTHMGQFVDGMEERSAQMKLRVTEEREKFSREYISSKLTAMTPVAKNAVKRMVRYSGQNGNMKLNRSRIMDFMKEHRPEFIPEKNDKADRINETAEDK